MSRENVEKIAQGRVWSGQEARKLGLVDAMGGLDAAVAYAARKAGIAGPFRIVEYPEKKSLSEEIADLLGKSAPESERASGSGVVAEIATRIEGDLADLRAFNDPKDIYARMPLDLSIR
jgi:protease-4